MTGAPSSGAACLIVVFEFDSPLRAGEDQRAADVLASLAGSAPGALDMRVEDERWLAVKLPADAARLPPAEIIAHHIEQAMSLPFCSVRADVLGRCGS